MNGTELFVGGVAALAVLSVVVRGWVGVMKSRAAADVARAGVSPVSLLGHIVVTAGAIVGVQWLVITYAASNSTLLLVVLAIPALLAAYTLTRATTVLQVKPARPAGGRR